MITCLIWGKNDLNIPDKGNIYEPKEKGRELTVLEFRPWYISGFTDAALHNMEGSGCINIIVSKTTSASIGNRVEARFIIE